MKIRVDFPRGTICLSGALISDSASMVEDVLLPYIEGNADELASGLILTLDLQGLTGCDDKGMSIIILGLLLVKQIENANPIRVLGADVVARLLKSNGSSKLLRPLTTIIDPYSDGQYYKNRAAPWI